MFSTPKESHKHSLETLNILDGFIDFKCSINDLLDIGCGKCYDLSWWVNINDGDLKNPQPLNIKCVGLDIIKPSNKESMHENIYFVEHDFNSTDRLPFSDRKFDVVWCHDVLQYAHNPLKLLGAINYQMATNSMLYICVPSTVNVLHGKFHNYTFSKYYSTFTMTQLIYLLALNGFDCKNGYFKKNAYEDIIQIVTYKNTEPFDYVSSWYNLLEENVFSDNISKIISSKGYLTDNGLVTTWLDGEVYDYRYHS